MADATETDRYEPPRIEERADIVDPLILATGSGNFDGTPT